MLFVVKYINEWDRFIAAAAELRKLMAYDIGTLNLMLPTYGFGGFQSTGQGISDWAQDV